MNETMRLIIFRTGCNPPWHPASPGVIGNRAPRRFSRVRFRVDHRRQAPRDHAPMIKSARNVPHLFRTQPLDATQREIVILGTFKSFAEPAYLAQQIGAITAEM